MSANQSKVELPFEASPFLFFTAGSAHRVVRVLPLIFAIIIALVCHALFSPLGLNPTDDGLQLAFARRVLDGQWPHRDFFSVRTALSYVLWAPVVAWGGNSVIFLSRAIVWLQWALISWLWASVLLRHVLRKVLTPSEELLCVAGAFFLGSHTFPIMAWHTIDGLFLISLGLAATKSSRSSLRLLGWLLIGFAPLSKQSFFLAVPLLLLVSPYRPNWRAWCCAILPGLAYTALFLLKGSGRQLLEQLTANSRFFRTAFAVYVIQYPPFLGVVAAAAAWISLGRIRRHPLCERYRVQGAVSLLFVAGIFAPLPWLLFWHPAEVSIHLFAVALGLALGSSATRPHFALPARRKRHSHALALFATEAAIVAWCSALSIAVNYPALAAGALWCAIFAILTPERLTMRRHSKLLYGIALTLTIGGLIVVFHDARRHKIYREAPAEALTASLDGVMAGAAYLRTNVRTAALLADLHDLTTSFTQQRRRYAILPDCSAWWIRAAQRNPLPLVWDNEVELPNSVLREQAIRALEASRGQVTVLVTRYETDALAEKLRPLAPRYPLTQYLRSHWRQVGETAFFELYE
jgi:hypothetical protein